MSTEPTSRGEVTARVPEARRGRTPWTRVSHPRETSAPVEPGPGADWIACEDGQRLYSRWQWPDRVRSIVWYVLGPEGGASPYPRFTRALLDAGFAVTLFHPRGTGYSPGLRGDIDDYERFLGDYRRFRAEIDHRVPGVPLFLVGHSAGASFAAELAATGTPNVAGVVLVNPAYRLRATKGMTPTWFQYATYAANLLFRPSALTVDMNSRPSEVAFGPDREEATALQRDPRVVRFFSMRMMRGLKRLMDRLPANVGALGVPVLVVEGAHDALVDSRGNDELLARAKATGSAKLIVPDGGHGSSAVETAFESLVRWLEDHLATRARAVHGVAQLASR